MHSHTHATRINSWILSLILPSLLFFMPAVALAQESGSARGSFGSIVDRVKEQYAPDTRVEVFNIEVKDQGSQLIVSGELADGIIRTALLDALAAEAGSKALVDSVRMLPAEELQPEIYGIVRISVANLRRKPSVGAELVSQTLLGTVLKILKEEHGFYYVQNRDGYLGWISRSSMIRVDTEAVKKWKKDPRVVVTAVYEVVRKERQDDAEIVVDLVPGVVLQKVGKKGRRTKVKLPDDRKGYVKTAAVIDEAELGSIQATGDRLVSVARKYLGIPYLWGGTSGKGFDCSGFIQTVYRMNNRELPRDANQMVRVGEPVEFGEDYENLKPGDLLFFGSSPERISHVALYMGDKLFIHSAAWVHINSLDPEHPLFNEYWYNTIRAARRHIAD